MPREIEIDSMVRAAVDRLLSDSDAALDDLLAVESKLLADLGAIPFPSTPDSKQSEKKTSTDAAEDDATDPTEAT